MKKEQAPARDLVLTRDQIIHGYHQLGEELTDEKIETWLRCEELSPCYATYFWREVNYQIAERLKSIGSRKLAARRRQENGSKNRPVER